MKRARQKYSSLKLEGFSRVDRRQLILEAPLLKSNSGLSRRLKYVRSDQLRIIRMLRYVAVSIGADSERRLQRRSLPRRSAPSQLSSPRREARPRRLHTRC